MNFLSLHSNLSIYLYYLCSRMTIHLDVYLVIRLSKTFGKCIAMGNRWRNNVPAWFDDVKSSKFDKKIHN